jgi:hypothetical protein
VPITALQLMLAVLACRSATALHKMPYALAETVDVQWSDTTAHRSSPDSVPRSLFKALGTVSGKPLGPGKYIKDIVIVDFEPRTSAATRKAAFDAIRGTVVGGSVHREAPGEGTYYVRIVGGTASSLMHAVMTLRALPQVAFAAPWAVTPLDLESSQRPRKAAVSRSLTRPDTLSRARPGTSRVASTPSVMGGPPDSVPRALFKALGTVSGKPLLPGVYIRDIVIVDFELGATAAQRRAALAAVGGVVVGGQRYSEDHRNGTYYVRVTGGTTSSLLRAVTILQGLPQVSFAAAWPLTPLDLESSRPAR